METSAIASIETSGAGERHAAPESVEKVDFDKNRYREGQTGRSEHAVGATTVGQTKTETEAMGCSVSSLRSEMMTASLTRSRTRAESVAVVEDGSDTNSLGSEDSEIGASLWNFHRDEALEKWNDENWPDAEDSLNLVLSRYPKQEPVGDPGKFQWQMWLARAQGLQGKWADALRTLQHLNLKPMETSDARGNIDTVRLQLAIADVTFNQADKQLAKSASKKAIKLAKKLQKSIAVSKGTEEDSSIAQTLFALAIRQMVVILTELGENADARAYKSLLSTEIKSPSEEDIHTMIYLSPPEMGKERKDKETSPAENSSPTTVQNPSSRVVDSTLREEEQRTQLYHEAESLWSPPKPRRTSIIDDTWSNDALPPGIVRKYNLQKYNGWILGQAGIVDGKLFDAHPSELNPDYFSSLEKEGHASQIESEALRDTLEKAIWEAIEVQDIDSINWIYSDPRVKGTKFKSNLYGLHGGSPLHVAVRRNRYHIAKSLLRNNFNIHETDDSGETALFTVMLNKAEHQLSYVQMFVNAGADVNHQRSDGQTVMHMVAKWGTIEVADFLISSGAHIHIANRDSLGNTPLSEAIGMKRGDMVKCLVEHGANVYLPKLGHETMVQYASRLGYQDVVNILEQNAVNPLSVKKATPQEQFHRGETIEKKMEKYRLTKRNGFLVELIGGGYIGTPEMWDNRLLDEPNAPKELQNLREAISKAIRQAVYQDDLEAIKFIYSDPRISRTKFEITYTPPNSGREATAPPLHAAVDYGFMEIVKAMLDAGTDVNTVDRAGSFHALCRAIYAPKESRSLLVGLLLDRGASVNFVSSSDGMRPLHMAASVADIEICRQLYFKGANINATSIQNETALFLAVKTGQVTMVEWLLLRGADKNIRRTQNKETPLQYAKKNKLLLIEKLLKKSYT